MVVDESLAIGLSLLAGLAGGFLSSFMAWNASGEKFDFRKHGNALITGTLSGLAGGVASAVLGGEGVSTGQLALQLFGIFFGVIGIDRLRSDTSKAADKPKNPEPTAIPGGPT